MHDIQSPFLDTISAAHWLGLKPATLEKRRVTGGGPAFRRHGTRVVYKLADLEAWSDARLRLSTSDAGPTVRPVFYA